MQGLTMEQARTVAVNVFVLIEIFYLFNSRSLKKPIREIGYFSNPFVYAGAGVMLLLQLLFTYWPAMNSVFQTAPVPGMYWGIIVLYSLAVYGAVSLHKRFASE